MRIAQELTLPRDALSVPLVRRVLDQSLAVLGVARECIDDIELALTEACTNVLYHARDGDQLDVTVRIDGQACVLEVTDAGGGFDIGQVRHDTTDTMAPGGRGIELMRSLVDDVHFTPAPGHGTVVHLEKRLEWATLVDR